MVAVTFRLRFVASQAKAYGYQFFKEIYTSTFSVSGSKLTQYIVKLRFLNFNFYNRLKKKHLTDFLSYGII